VNYMTPSLDELRVIADDEAVLTFLETAMQRVQELREKRAKQPIYIDRSGITLYPGSIYDITVIEHTVQKTWRGVRIANNPLGSDISNDRFAFIGFFDTALRRHDVATNVVLKAVLK
jgi:hypothetical protein